MIRLAGLGVLALPLLAMMMLAVLTGVGSGMWSTAQAPIVVNEMNPLHDVPVELEDRLKQEANAAHVDWAQAAGYLKVEYGWTALPLPSRMELAEIPVVEEVPCDDEPPTPAPPGAPPGLPHPLSVAASAPQEEDDVCTIERPPTRVEVELRWQEQVEEWLPGVMAKLAATDGDLTAPPLNLSGQKAMAATEAADAIREIGALRSHSKDRADLREATFNENYQLVLRSIDWAYQYPVPGAPPHDDWHYERPQNAAMGLPEWHQGADIFAARGTPVLAVTDGTITQRGWNIAGGRTVELTDPFTGIRFYYAHLEDWAAGVEEGREVKAGDVIGYVGTSGEGPPGTDDVIQEPHLHFGVYLPTGEVSPPYPYLTAWWEMV